MGIYQGNGVFRLYMVYRNDGIVVSEKDFNNYNDAIQYYREMKEKEENTFRYSLQFIASVIHDLSKVKEN